MKKLVNESLNTISSEDKIAIKKYILNYEGDFNDDDIHAFAEEKGLDKHKVEEYIYSLTKICLKKLVKESLDENLSYSPPEIDVDEYVEYDLFDSVVQILVISFNKEFEEAEEIAENINWEMCVEEDLSAEEIIEKIKEYL